MYTKIDKSYKGEKIMNSIERVIATLERKHISPDVTPTKAEGRDKEVFSYINSFRVVLLF